LVQKLVVLSALGLVEVLVKDLAGRLVVQWVKELAEAWVNELVRKSVAPLDLVSVSELEDELVVAMDVLSAKG
jgi:hypothetical protein